ncbi:hypothetical protein [Clostridium sp.]|uniref:hypothetical protein n=1 Tax=Clostridium sp. TaxID=1506 RepID=UPI002FC60EB1
MTITKEQTFELVSLAINTIAQLSEKDIKALLNKQAMLTVKFNKKDKSKISSLETKELKNYEKHAQAIINFNTRDEARAYINSSKLKKPDLIFLSKFMSVHINRSDKKEDIINNIIESVIGSRLRVEAIKHATL